MSRTIIAAGALAAYGHTFSAPLLLDDTASIAENLSIRWLWPIWRALSPPNNAGVGGRPLLNLSFAVNYAFGDTSVFGYHLVNLVIHVLAGWTLFALVRGTLRRPVLAERFGSAATVLSLAVGAIWTWHPVQTGSVTYLSERAESLMGLFYLLTLYCFMRGAETDNRGRGRIWFAFSVLACLAGVATKEVIVTAPLLVFLYDRTFISGGFSGAWRRHWPLYLALAATWIPLGHLMTGLHQRGVGFGEGIAWWAYGLAECRVIVKYLLLAFWPHPLVFDYGNFVSPRLSEVWPYIPVLAMLLAMTAWAFFCPPAEQRVFRLQSPQLRKRLWRLPRRSSRPASEDGRPSGFGGQALGFAGAWFFLILAPTSSIVPIAGQPMAESRLYVPLAGLAALAVLGAFSLVGRWSLAVFAVAAAGLIAASSHRNRAYASAQAIWEDTIAKNPANARAHKGLGDALELMPDRLNDAIAEFDTALRLEPNYSKAYSGQAGAYVKEGHYTQAIAVCNKAIHLDPGDAAAYSNRSVAYLGKGDPNRAIADCNVAIRLNPAFVEAYGNRADADVKKGDYGRAVADYAQAIRLNPGFATAYDNLAWLWATCPDKRIRSGQKAMVYAQKACDLTEWEEAADIDTLAAACAEAGHFDEAVKWETKYIESGPAKDAADSARQRLALYARRKAYHEDRKSN